MYGSAKREGEGLLQCWLVLDLATDVADDAAEPVAQQMQLLPRPAEHFGIGVARSGHGCSLDHAAIQLPSLTPCRLARQVSPLAACKSLASVGKVMAFGCTVVRS